MPLINVRLDDIVNSILTERLNWACFKHLVELMQKPNGKHGLKANSKLRDLKI